MTTTAHGTRADTDDAAVRTEVINALALQGVTAATITTLFDGREWCVTVSEHSPALTDTEVRVAVWNTVLNCAALYGVRRPVEGVRVRIGG
ncbi:MULTISPECIES: hypothetical protein [Kocuria]|uniref:hypothetical protein n=1 Tax=Kocuria TaxID=57493 RepID=UPI00203BC0C6|nr:MULTISPECIES: hypothetical protein [Kocuria]MCM3687046.1 hypothetical protein [Kocuria rosea]HST72341.1 hypothetical protein [Kocuria rosea]